MAATRSIKVYQVDVFAENVFEGNAASVVPDAQQLSGREMQQIARELNNSETAFLLPARDDSHDVWVRFFTPETEVPLCGHATLAAQAIFACRRGLDHSPERQMVVRQGAAGGGWTVTVMEGGCYAEMLQVPVRFLGAPSPELSVRVLQALGLDPAEIDVRCPIEMHSTGHAKLLVGIRSRSTLDALRPDLGALAAVGKQLGINGFFLFTLDTDHDQIATDCRMFAPGIGIPEDPVTGSGQGPLGAYLVRHRLLEPIDGGVEFLSTQGRVLGRPGVARVRVDLLGELPRRVWVGGRTRVVFETTIELPPIPAPDVESMQTELLEAAVGGVC